MALMNKRHLVLLALVACLTGCVPVASLNPLYTDKDVVFDESLLGEWVGADANEKGGMKFIKEGNDAYVVVSSDTDANGEQIVDAGWSGQRAIRMEDIAATVYSALGINWTKSIEDTPSGRKFEYVPFGANGLYVPINEVFG